MGKKREQPKIRKKPAAKETIRVGADPDSYLKKCPVWRFRDFDWEGPWGYDSFKRHIGNIRTHVEQHLSSLETMTWDEILKASGGRGAGKGNNHHEIAKDKFKKEARDRLDEKSIFADSLFSLRMDAGTRIYGVRESNTLRIVFFDPYHKDKKLCAYDYDS